MRIYHNKLGQSLQQGLPLAFLVFGDEPWQKIDALNQIKQKARSQGFEELIQYSADDKFDWQLVESEYQAMSLFASQKIIEVELVNGKISESGSKALTELAAQLIPDNLLILHGAKLETRVTKKKWFTQLEKQGVYLPVYDIEGNHLSQWLNNQARLHGLSLTGAASAYLVTILEGNLLALSQELEKFALLFPNQQIDVEQIESLTIKQAKFNPFQLIDTLLAGNFAKLSTMLESLHHDGMHATQMLWIIHKELNQLAQLHEQLQRGANFNDLCKALRIWDKRKPIYQNALKNTELATIYIALSRLASVDQQLKSSSDFNDMLLILDICVSVFHGQLTQGLTLDYQ